MSPVAGSRSTFTETERSGTYASISWCISLPTCSIFSPVLSIILHHSETPDSALGQVVPIIYTDISIEGESVDELLGGFSATIVAWDAVTDFSILFLDDETFATEVFETDTAFVDVFAFDADNGVFDSRVFPYNFEVDGNAAPSFSAMPATGEAPVEAPTTDREVPTSPSSSVTFFDGRFALLFTLFLIPLVLQ